MKFVAKVCVYIHIRVGIFKAKVNRHLLGSSNISDLIDTLCHQVRLVSLTIIIKVVSRDNHVMSYLELDLSNNQHHTLIM